MQWERLPGRDQARGSPCGSGRLAATLRRLKHVGATPSSRLASALLGELQPRTRRNESRIAIQDGIPVLIEPDVIQGDEVTRLIAGPSVFICNECVGACQLYLDNPHEQERLLFEDGTPVFKDGKPVFVPISDEEKAQRDARYDFDAPSRSK